MLKMPASCAPLSCMPSGAWPTSCIAVITCMETPVAPIGWPLAFSPPDGLTGSLPSFCVQPSRIARAPCPRDGEAVVGFDERQIGKFCAGLLQRALPGHRAALELQDVALGHRQEILRMRGGANVDGLAHGLRG